jgi:hypothetical protein
MQQSSGGRCTYATKCVRTRGHWRCHARQQQRSPASAKQVQFAKRWRFRKVIRTTTPFSRCVLASEFCDASSKIPFREKRRERSAGRRNVLKPRFAGAAAVRARDRSPLGAPLRFSSCRPNAVTQAQAALHASKRMRALPAPSLALKQSTLRAGPNAGGDDARDRPGARLRASPAGTALAPISGSSLETPFTSELGICNYISDTSQRK